MMQARDTDQTVFNLSNKVLVKTPQSRDLRSWGPGEGKEREGNKRKWGREKGREGEGKRGERGIAMNQAEKVSPLSLKVPKWSQL